MLGTFQCPVAMKLVAAVLDRAVRNIPATTEDSFGQSSSRAFCTVNECDSPITSDMKSKGRTQEDQEIGR